MPVSEKEESSGNRRLRVYLSHAGDDDEIVGRLYDLLKADGFEPRLIISDPRGGGDWDKAGVKVLEEADVILFCLSQNNAQLRRFWNEMKYGIDLLSSGDQSLALIAARLEEYPVPAALSSLRLIDLFNEDGYGELVKTLRYYAERSDIRLPPARKGRSQSLAVALAEWRRNRRDAAAGAAEAALLKGAKAKASEKVSRTESGGGATKAVTAPASESVTPPVEANDDARPPVQIALASESVGEGSSSGEISIGGSGGERAGGGRATPDAEVQTAHASPQAEDTEASAGVETAQASVGVEDAEGSINVVAAPESVPDESADDTPPKPGAEAQGSPPDETTAPEGAPQLPPPPRLVRAGMDEGASERNAINDKPQDDVEQDTLGFRDYVFALRDFIVSQDTTTPLTISINGAWGSGKSSLMSMLRHQLEPPRPRDLWRFKLLWLLGWARGTLVVLAGRLLIRFGHRDSDYIRLGLAFDTAALDKDYRHRGFDFYASQLFERHVAAGAAAQFPHLAALPPETAQEYLDELADRSRRWAVAAARREKMEPPAHPTVWFNAWKFSQQEQVWSALAVAVLDQLKTKYNFFTRAFFLVRLTLRRTDKSRALAHLARKLLVPAALAFASAVAYQLFYEKFKTGVAEKYFVLPATLAWLAPALTAVWKLWKEVENPFHLPIKELIDAPAYEEKVGFIGAFEEDFGRIVEVAIRRSFFWRPRKLVVFIDDLDRCSPLQAASIIEAINLFLDSVGCVFVLGMDVAAVATSIEVKYKELTERMRRDAPDVVSPGNLFLDKIVQVPFDVPRPTKRYIEALVTSITEPRAARRPIRFPLPRPDFSTVTPDTATAAADPLLTLTAATLPPPTTPSPDAHDPAAPPDDDNNAAAPAVDRGSYKREDIKQAVVFASRLLKENPRQVKRFINLFRLQIYIANQRELLSEEGEYGLTPKRLAVWVAWYMQWPEILKLLSGMTYGDELRKNLLSISRRVSTDEEETRAWWAASDQTAYVDELKKIRLLAEDSPAHWSKLPWAVWVRDADFLHCLKHLEPYWEDQGLLDSVADMTQFTVAAAATSGAAATNGAAPAPHAPAPGAA